MMVRRLSNSLRLQCLCGRGAAFSFPSFSLSLCDGCDSFVSVWADFIGMNVWAWVRFCGLRCFLSSRSLHIYRLYFIYTKRSSFFLVCVIRRRYYTLLHSILCSCWLAFVFCIFFISTFYMAMFLCYLALLLCIIVFWYVYGLYFGIFSRSRFESMQWLFVLLLYQVVRHSEHCPIFSFHREWTRRERKRMRETDNST